MEDLDFLVSNWSVIKEKNDGNEAASLSDTDEVEVNLDSGSHMDRDEREPEEDEKQNSAELDNPLTLNTRGGRRKKTSIILKVLGTIYN